MIRYIIAKAIGHPVRLCALAVFGGALATTACHGVLTDVTTPDQISPDMAASAAGANAQRVAAIGNFATFYGGDVSGTGVGVNIASGLLSDEMESARGGTEHLDQRSGNDALFPLTSPWSFVGQAQTQLIRAVAAVQKWAPETSAADKAAKATQLAQLYLYEGFVYTILAENYCNGIPVGDANDVAPQTPILSNADLYTKALAQFDLAISTAGATQADLDIKNAALVGKGRVKLNQNDYAAAAGFVGSVPDKLVLSVAYSSASIVNAVFDWMNTTLNFAPADREGGNGLPFVSANDPRVTVKRTAAGAVALQAGQDGVRHAVQTVYSQPNQSIPLATGVEARLIEAEAALKGGDPITFMSKVNAARATRSDLPPLADPGVVTDTAARTNLLFKERGFWFWGTAHRLGDLRRLVRQYKRPTETVFPTGNYFKGGTFGTDVTLIPAQAEKNNTINGVPYAGCTDRAP
jgi:hypothetical protein